MNTQLQHTFHNGFLHIIITLMLAATLTLSTLLPVHAAASEVASPTGTLTIRPKYGDKVLTTSDYDGTFQLYHIADYVETGTFTRDGDLADLDVTIDAATLADDESYKELTQAIAAYVEEHSADIQPVHKGIQVDETLTLSYGLYLITADQLATGYQGFESFLVMLPEYGENTVTTNVIAYPKVSPEPDEPDEPDEPHKPHEPGTPSTPPTPETPPVPEIEEPGGIEEIPEIEEIGGFTGDESAMMLYGIVAVAAAAALIVWTLWRRNQRRKTR